MYQIIFRMNSKERKPKKCATCGKEFYPRTSLDKYCSYGCVPKKEVKKVTPKERICIQCGKKFIPLKPLQNVCSVACYCERFRKKRAIQGVKKMSAKQRNQEQELLLNKIRLREILIGEIGHLYCEHCDRSIGVTFEIHHLVYRSEKPDHPKLHNLKNLYHICVTRVDNSEPCHKLFHRLKGTRNKIVRQRRLDKLFGADVLDK